VPRTDRVVKSESLNKFMFEGWTAKLTALRQVEITMVLKVLIYRRVNYEFVGQKSNISGLDRAHDTSGFPLLIGGKLHCLGFRP
jgi:hypothetical protein